MNNEYNSWCKWHPLKTVMLGRSYYPEFYRDIKNPKVKDCLVQIAEETEEDFKNYEKVLKDFGCKVIRPELDINQNIMDHIDYYGTEFEFNLTVPVILRPPAQPRDGQLVMGNEMLFTGQDHHAIKDKLLEHNSIDNFSIEDLVYPARGSDKHFDAPCVTCVGNRVYIDSKEVNEEAIQLLKTRYPEREFIQVKIGGHSDGCFHTLKEGAILSLSRYTEHAETFPGWDVCFLPDQSWELVLPFINLKKRNGGKWWLAGEEKNNDFTTFVETWLKDWVGYVEESVFDVNVMMLDDKHVCVNNYNKIVFDFLEKNDIEPIIVPFRHRYFWDGGLHCVTLDLYREGEMENYFK